MKRLLDVGCGKFKHNVDGFDTIGVDIEKDSHADVIHDLNILPYPFKDEEFDMIVCKDVLEHLNDVLKVIEEFNRILKSDGKMMIAVPHFTSYNMYSNVDHRRFFATSSFNGFSERQQSHNMKHITKSRFEITKRKLIFKIDVDRIKKRNKNLKNMASIYNIYAGFLEFIFNRIQIVYENSGLCWMFPARSINFELIKVK